MNTEHEYLKELIKEGTPVTIFTMNGYQLHGIIEGHDEHIIVFRSEGVRRMTYKHAVSTIVPRTT